MKKKINFFANFFLILLLATVAFAQEEWFQQTSGIPCNLSSVYFVNENKGWSVSGSCPAGGLLMSTTDGGSQWITNYTIPLFSIHFIDENTGWTVGGDPYGGRIKKTTDGGITWITQVNLEDYGFSSVFFLDENIGYVSGVYLYISRRGVVFKTTNGGDYWFNTIPYYYTTEGLLCSVCFVNQNLGWAAGENGIIRRTTNGGNAWDIQTIEDAYLRSVFFIDENIGWLVGWKSPGGVILKSTNGGSNWLPISLGILSNHYVEDVYFVDTSTGWVVGENGLIIKTTNGGTSWDVQNSGTSNSLHSIHFIDQNIGWAVGDDATILHTTNGGVTFVNKKEIDEEPIDFSLEQNYPNPFNPSTKINFEIPGQARNDNTLVTLKVYDVLGNEIATLISEEKQPGTYEVEFDGTALPSGIYFYKLKAGYFVETKKMILLR
jgi:photosystem II stability/assembly factor-like uncharacterized protein